MYLFEKVRNILFYLIKKEYTLYLKLHKISILNDSEIENFIEHLFYTKTVIFKKKILNKLEKTCQKEDYNKEEDEEEISELIDEILEDKDLITNRLKLEIESYQESNKSYK